jgi:sugar phosphate isomerase/epimerase
MIQSSILHSVSYSGSWGQQLLSLEDFVDKAADLGFDGVMLMAKRPHLSFLDWNAKSRAKLREHVERRGLKVACLAGYTNFTGDLDHSDIPNREFQIGYVTGLAEMANDLGCNLVRIFTGYESSAAQLNVQLKLVADSLRECARRAAEFGVTVGVQNHHDLACGFESLYDLIQEVDEPNCRAMFDAWAPALHGVDLPAAASHMGKITVFTTMADYQLRPRYHYRPALVNYEKSLPMLQAVPMGEGFIDYAAFLAALEEGGFGGPVAYEMCSPLRGGGSIQNLDSYARKFLEFVSYYRDSRRTGTGQEAR